MKYIIFLGSPDSPEYLVKSPFIAGHQGLSIRVHAEQSQAMKFTDKSRAESLALEIRNLGYSVGMLEITD